MTFASGQFGPDALLDTSGNAMAGATCTASGYACTVDGLGNMTVTGPAADSVAVSVTPLGGSASTIYVKVLPLTADLAAIQTTANAAETPAGAQTKVNTAITALVGGAAAALDTLGEIGAQLGSDESAASALTAAVALRQIIVNHGAVAGTARPTSSLPVKWYGTVAPTNAATNDEWWDQSIDLAKRWSGTAWVASGNATFVSASIASTPGWVRRRTRLFPSLVQQVMASPPTVGAATTVTSLGSGVTRSSLNPPGQATTQPASTAFFTYTEGGSPVQQGTTFPNYNYVLFPASPTNPTGSVAGKYRVEFLFDGTTLELLYKGTTGAYQLWVDGQPVTAAATTTPNDGNTYFLPVTFATRKPRRIEFRAYGCPWGGVRVGANDTVRPVVRNRPRCIVLGDSYTEGSALSNPPTSFVASLGDLLDWETWASGVGGTGYLNPGTGGRVKFRDRVATDVIAFAPDIVIVQGGHNDNVDTAAYTAAALTAEATALFAAIRAGLPNALIIALGPIFAGGSTYTLTQAAIFAATGANLYIDTLAAPYFTGTGHVGATTGSGNSDLYIGTDGIHPVQAGHDWLARCIAEGVASQIAV